MRFGDKRLPQRFWGKVERDDGGHWIWTGAKAGGYGQIRWTISRGNAITTAPARLVLGVLLDGDPMPHPCDEVIRLCGETLCVHPRHLRAASRKEKAEHYRITHCKRGHELTPSNVEPNGRGGRACKVCRRDRQMKRYRARKEAGQCISCGAGRGDDGTTIRCRGCLESRRQHRNSTAQERVRVAEEGPR